MRRKTFYGFLAILIAAAIFLACAIGSSWFTNGDIRTWFNSWGQKTSGGESSADNSPDDNNDNVGTEPILEDFAFTSDTDNKHISLLVTPYMDSDDNVIEEGEDVEIEPVRKKITAVVTTTVKNPKLDWSIYVDGAEENETDYSDIITIEPIADGSSSVIVTCYNAFDETFVIKATLRDVGVYSTCKVKFVGIPKEIYIVAGRSLVPIDEYEIDDIGTIDFTIVLDNVYHKVGEKFYNLTVSKVINGLLEYCDLSFVPVNADVSAGEFIYDTKIINRGTEAFSNWILSPHPSLLEKSETYFEEDTFNGYIQTPLMGGKFINSVYSFTLNHSFFSHCGLISKATLVRYAKQTLYRFIETPTYKITFTEEITGISTELTLTFSPALLSKVEIGDDVVEF